MTLLLDVMIPGDPVGKGRPRCTCRGGKPRMYTPEKTREWETHAAEWMAIHYGGEPITGAVRVDVVAYRKRPKSHRATIEQEFCDVGTDADNVLKAFLDALQLAHVVADDRTVVDARVVKRWCRTNQEPAVWGRVWGV